MRELAGLVAVLLAAGLVFGAEDVEATARKLEARLMAPCCGSSTLADHYSGPAESMKREIRAMLAAGKTEGEILDFYVDKHGPQILSAPPAEAFGLVAYLGGPFLFLLGIGLMVVLVRRWRRAAPAPAAGKKPPPVDPAYAERLRRELSKLT